MDQALRFVVKWVFKYTKRFDKHHPAPEQRDEHHNFDVPSQKIIIHYA